MHGHFTRQPYTVVRGHIEHFTQPGDLVLDPFGGSGITAIEAMMLRRRACHVDINPLSALIVNSLASPVDLYQLSHVSESICTEYERLEPQNQQSIQEALQLYPRPRPIALACNADVSTADLLFTQEQIAKLGLLKSLIDRITSAEIKNALLLAFSGLVSKINLTFHASAGRGDSAGNASPFQYYRYRIAKAPAQLPVLHTFRNRIKNIIAAKQEIEPSINASSIGNLQVVRGSATQLDFLPDQSVDYIYTDPPYGAKIPYLDLSAMWLAWLDAPASEQDYALEAIQSGSRSKSKAEYNGLMRAAIREMHRVLKYDRWLPFVYAHKDPAFWHVIIEQAESCGFEYRSAVSQPVGKVSFKKRQRPFTVLCGQLVLHFYKSRAPHPAAKGQLEVSVARALEAIIETAIAQHHGATIEQINDAIVIRALEQGFLDRLQREYQDLTPLLADRYEFHEETETYHLRPRARFADTIPLQSRIRYYLTSILWRENPQGCYPNSDQLILDVLPLLKNGCTPEGQTILDELQQIAHTHMDGWRLNEFTGLF